MSGKAVIYVYVTQPNQSNQTEFTVLNLDYNKVH